MEETRTAEFESNGKSIKIEVKMTKKVIDDISYADGYNLNLGKKTFESVEIRLLVDGKVSIFSRSVPTVIDRLGYRDYNKMVAAGVHARLGDKFISQKPYDLIMAMMAELEQIADAEYVAIKAVEIQKEQDVLKAYQEADAKHQQHVKNGLCPKCHTYCYGDCQS